MIVVTANEKVNTRRKKQAKENTKVRKKGSDIDMTVIPSKATTKMHPVDVRNGGKQRKSTSTKGETERMNKNLRWNEVELITLRPNTPLYA